MVEAYICDAVRTPIGRYGGSLSSVRTDDLAAVPIRALLERNTGLNPAEINDVFFECANQAGEDNRNVARMATLLAGLPVQIPGTTLNRLCASGADAAGTAARAVTSGELDLVIAGGVESMSRAPYVMGKSEKAWDRSRSIEDTTLGWRFINKKMHAAYGVDSMSETAENVAELHNVTREDQDAFALQSQQRAAHAQQAGYFAEEIIPVTVSGKSGDTAVTMDEHPRPETNLSALEKLNPIVRDGGSVTAGNASGVNDGAAALLIANDTAIKRHSLVPRARFLGMATAGVEPRLMGMGPVPASRKLLSRLNLSVSDMDVIEINEAFAAQVIASARELGINPESDILNAHGGAIALGHPLGMSGTRLVMTAIHALENTKGKLALITMCVGVGQGLSIAIEKE